MSGFDDVVTFVRVVDAGGFSRAAERLGVTKSVVSRRVARLEASLGTRLLARTTRGVGATEAGAAFAARCRRVLADLEEARAAAAGRDGEPAGALRLAVPLAFGMRHLAPALAEFAGRHPRLALETAYAERAVDLVAEGFDAAIRIGALADSSLKARRLAPVRSALVASPAYLRARGEPTSLRDLAAHDCIVSTHAPVAGQWRFRAAGAGGGRWVSVTPERVRFRSDNGDAMCAAAIEGLGLAVLPTFITGDAIGAGRLRPILKGFATPERALHVVWPPAAQPPGKVRVLIDFLARRFGPEPYWDPCWRAAAGSIPSPATGRADELAATS